MEYGLLGDHLGHSYSPLIHSHFGDYAYDLIECTPEQLRTLMLSRDFKGLNVTMPYKKDVMPYCDELTDVAREIGCVNTLVMRKDGTLLGHNTDIGGIMSMLRKAGIDPEGRKCCILGSGATSQTARTALRRMNAKEITVISRRGPVTYDDLYALHADCKVLINCTPSGMFPNNGQCAADISRLPHLIGVADVIYNPERSALILDAMERGIPCVSGLAMLVGQAREAAEYFTGKTIAPSADDDIIAAIHAQTLNLILTGMPGSGKSTIGEALAEKLGRPYVCTDEEIVRRTGMSIPEIFEKYGEARFRDIESEVMEDVCKHPGQVISTGGGVILRKRNVRAMRQNGRIVFLKRDIDILPRDGRPLSSSQEAVHNLWETRKDLYYGCADAVVENNATVEEAVEKATEGFYEATRH